MGLLRRSSLLAAALVVAFAGVAQAAPNVSKPDAGTLLVRSTTAGEANQIATTRTGGQIVIEEQAAAGLAAGPCTQTDATTATCSATGITRIRMQLGPGDDQVVDASHAIRQELFGEAGDDSLVGGAGHDLIDGGPGIDGAVGSAGNDRLQMEDGTVDAGFDCGDGDDDADHDLAEPFGGNCEVHAPEFDLQPTIASDGVFRVWTSLTVDNLAVVSDEPGRFPAVAIRWMRCDALARCALASPDVQSGAYSLGLPDAGHTFFAEVEATNRAGTKTVRTPSTPVIEPPPVVPPAPETPSAVELLRRWSGELDLALQRALAPIARSDIRRLASRRSVRLRVTFGLPTAAIVGVWRGPLDIQLTVPARTARRHGHRSRSRKPLVIARGRTTGRLRATTSITLRTTKAGRRVLRGARRLRIDVAASIVTDPNVAGITAQERLMLRRRR